MGRMGRMGPMGMPKTRKGDAGKMPASPFGDAYLKSGLPLLASQELHQVVQVRWVGDKTGRHQRRKTGDNKRGWD